MELNAQNQPGTGKILIAYFSWGGNTRGIARQIQQRTGGDLFEIELVKPYSSNYNTCLDEALRDQRANARPALKTHVSNMAQSILSCLATPTGGLQSPRLSPHFLMNTSWRGKPSFPFVVMVADVSDRALPLLPNLNRGQKSAMPYPYIIPGEVLLQII
jgi:hypothetical protein